MKMKTIFLWDKWNSPLISHSFLLNFSKIIEKPQENQRF